MLERDGYSVLEAIDEPSAWRAVHRSDNPISLALIDVDLPGLSGRYVAEHLQLLAPVRVLFMSGQSADALVADGQLAPGAPLLSKPFRVGQLLDAVGSELA